MQFTRKLIEIVITLPKTEVNSADYVKIYTDNATGTMSSTPLCTIFGVEEGTNIIFRKSIIALVPGTWKFQYTVFDKAGNTGTTSGVITEAVNLVPVINKNLYFVSYVGATQTLTLGNN